MTREEAIQDLKDILEEATSDEDAVCYVTSEDADALDMAIEALSGDKISRAELFNRLAVLKAPMEANEYKAEVYKIINEM